MVLGVLAEPIPDPSKFVPRDGELPRRATKRRNADLDAQTAAINCASLYVLVMTFAQNGLGQLSEYIDRVEEQSGVGVGVSEGYDIALDWFATLFKGCSEKARTVKSWLPDSSGVVPEMQLKYLDQFLFERAMSLVS
jgi:serine/threonine-protein kinase ULK/ATG1